MKEDNSVDMESLEEALEIEVIKGVEGNCLVINDTRVAGSKPWGGGTVIHKFTVPVKKIPAIQSLNAQETKKAEVRGQLMAINYALSKSQVFTYARSIGEIRAGEESGAVPISELDKRKRELEAELQAGSEK